MWTRSRNARSAGSPPVAATRDEPAQVERRPGWSRRSRRERRRGRGGGELGHQLRDERELLGREVGEVLLAQQLVGAAAQRLILAVAALARPRLVLGCAPDEAYRLAARLTVQRRGRRAQEPRAERSVERVEVVVSGDERLP